MSNDLACYAVTEEQSRKRQFPVTEHPYRSAFERDRDRIMHSSAFRRLEGKTQVFTPGVNDHYRTRLTHSIEVAQIGRTIARVLKVNESLTEAICLGHDLGHSPFGHCGEDALNSLMADRGGFEHNAQSLRIVDMLEHPYPDMKGLNLMYETRLGFARHHSPYDEPNPDGFSEQNCSLEGQITDIADRIAFNCHDLEDGLRAGLICEEELKGLSIFSEAQRRIDTGAITDDSVRWVRTAKSVIDMLVSDCIGTSEAAICKAGIETLEDVYGWEGRLIRLGSESEKQLGELEKFLLEKMYLHEEITRTAIQVRGWLEKLFIRFCEHPDAMPEFYQNLIQEEGLGRIVCDYIAGMTDRFCMTLLKED